VTGPASGPAIGGREPDESWRGVDEGWGRRAAEFAALAEPTNCREYVALHQHLGVGPEDHLLDVACGAGLAVELAGLRGARCAGIDASARLVAVARDRNPDADLRVGDMNALPWSDQTFDVVTSFRGIWGTTPGAVAEVHRVLAPGGRVGLTVWGHIKASPGAWALSPFSLASTPKVENQAAMVALGRPGAGEAVLTAAGFTDVERVNIPFVFEFADPESYARALATSGPAFEAIQAVGEESFLQTATELARERVREGLPLRAPIAVVGYLATKAPLRTGTGDPDRTSPARPPGAVGFLGAPAHTPESQRLFEDDLQGVGYVMNVSRLWAYSPSALDGLSSLMGQATETAGLTFRQRAVLVTAAASTLGDSYCSLAWGTKLAEAATPEVAAAVIRGQHTQLDVGEQALARWARRVVRDPNGIVASDVEDLREAGFDDEQIFAITTFVALRLAFSSVNDALGARPDHELGTSTAEAVRSAVSFGRGVESGADAEG
jgi:SAM-dependent methyltransferase/alkylhydroperoxidase family enzyme